MPKKHKKFLNKNKWKVPFNKHKKNKLNNNRSLKICGPKELKTMKKKPNLERKMKKISPKYSNNNINKFSKQWKTKRVWNNLWWMMPGRKLLIWKNSRCIEMPQTDIFLRRKTHISLIATLMNWDLIWLPKETPMRL